MHYIESGTGKPLLLLHAFPLDARMWNGARALLEEHFRVITPDQRGFGESRLTGDEYESAPAPSMDVLAEDVVALMDTLALNEVVLGGCSMGGYVAMEVLRTAPQRVAGLLLADTKPQPDDSDQAQARLAAAERAETTGVRDWLADSSLPNVLSETTHAQRPELVAKLRERIDQQPPEGVAWAQRAMANRRDSTEILRSFDRPALVVVGEDDKPSPPATARAMATTLPAAEFAVLPGTGHLAAVEDPRMFAEAVLPWLDAFY